jgi:hypothetical protein
VSSSSKANSSVSFIATEFAEGKIAEVDENMENFDLGDQLKDLMICQDDTPDKSTDTWETGLELHEDDDSIFSSFSSKFDKRYQVLAIVGCCIWLMTSPLGTPRGRCDEYSSKIFPSVKKPKFNRSWRGETND